MTIKKTSYLQHLSQLCSRIQFRRMKKEGGALVQVLTAAQDQALVQVPITNPANAIHRLGNVKVLTNLQPMPNQQQNSNPSLTTWWMPLLAFPVSHTSLSPKVSGVWVTAKTTHSATNFLTAAGPTLNTVTIFTRKTGSNGYLSTLLNC